MRASLGLWLIKGSKTYDLLQQRPHKVLRAEWWVMYLNSSESVDHLFSLLSSRYGVDFSELLVWHGGPPREVADMMALLFVGLKKMGGIEHFTAWLGLLSCGWFGWREMLWSSRIDGVCWRQFRMWCTLSLPSGY